jgi:hypothetical protein
MAKTMLICRAAMATLFVLGASAKGHAQLLQSRTGACTYTVGIGGTAFTDISPDAAVPGTHTAFPFTGAGGKLSYAPSPTPALFDVQMPFSVPMPGVTVNAFTIESNGALIEGNSLLRLALKDWTACGAFPYTGAVGQSCPPPFIALAPWWGDLSLCQSHNASMTYLLPANGSTSSPAIFQWTNASDDDRCSGNRPGINTYTFQIQIFPDGTIYYVYDAAGAQNGNNFLCGCAGTSGCTPCDFAIGAESADPSTGFTTSGIGLACNPVCNAAAFPAGQAFALQPNPQIDISNYTVGGNASVDGTVTVDLWAKNGGPGKAGTAIGFYFSNNIADCSGLKGGTPLATLGPLGGGEFFGCSDTSQEVRGEVPLTSPLVTAGPGYLIAAAIVNGQPTNPACFPLAVGPAQPDYTCNGGLHGVPQDPVLGGSSLNLSFELENIGATVPGQVPYAYYLSRTPTPTTSDFEVFQHFALAPGAGTATLVTDPNTLLPATLPPGVYTMGVILNPQGSISERSTTNNLCLSAIKLTVVCAGNPKIISGDSLPIGQTQVQYQTVLQATCGDGNYSWSLAAGSQAPPGLNLEPSGILRGVPTEASPMGAPFSFGVVVTDGQGKTATASLSLAVSSYTPELLIVTSGLPSGAVGVPYSASLTAIGGTPPYSWCGPDAPCPWQTPGALNPLSGILPLGVLLSPDGRVQGVPTAGGPYQFQVAVKDSAPQATPVTSGIFVVNIGEPGHLTITAASMPRATVGKYYQTSITAEGGTTPYRWEVVETQRLPTGTGDPGATLGAVLPSGLGLDQTSGNITGTPLVSGIFAVQMRATDSSTPWQSATDSIILTILPANGLQILNTYLPQGTLNAYYDVQLDTNAVDPAWVTFAAVDGAGNPSSSVLPPGITVTPDGRIQGRPTNTGTKTFLVRAQDDQNRLAIQALQLTVVGARKGGGCSAATGSLSCSGLLLVLGLFIRKRRRCRSTAMR